MANQEEILQAINKVSLSQKQLTELKNLRKKAKQQQHKIEKLEAELADAKLTVDVWRRKVYKAHNILDAFKIISNGVQENIEEEKERECY